MKKYKKFFPYAFFLLGGGLLMYAFRQYFDLVRPIDIAFSHIGSLCGEWEKHFPFSFFIIFFFPLYWEWLMLTIGAKLLFKRSTIKTHQIVITGILFGIMNIIIFMLSSILIFGENKAQVIPLMVLVIIYMAGRTVSFQKIFGKNLTKKQTIIFNIVLQFVAILLLLMIFVILDQRWEERDRKGTVITTNFNHADLRGKLGDAITSRIVSGVNVPMFGPDRRITKP